MLTGSSEVLDGLLSWHAFAPDFLARHSRDRVRNGGERDVRADQIVPCAVVRLRVEQHSAGDDAQVGEIEEALEDGRRVRADQSPAGERSGDCDVLHVRGRLSHVHMSC